MKSKAQTAMEYLLIMGAAILFVAIIIFIVQGTVLPPAEKDINASISSLKAGVASILPP